MICYMLNINTDLSVFFVFKISVRLDFEQKNRKRSRMCNLNDCTLYWQKEKNMKKELTLNVNYIFLFLYYIFNSLICFLQPILFLIIL